MKISVYLIFLLQFIVSDVFANSTINVEKWDVFELTFDGPSEGNPFTDVSLSAEFSNGTKIYNPEGFYNGKGVYKIRFMPVEEGQWSYITKSNTEVLNGKKGTFNCTPPSKNNHGPVRVRNTYYLAYEDGMPYFQIGTTCYAWAHQGEKMEQQTLKTLEKAPFNKMRMCIFPKDYVYNQNEPVYYPFEGEPLKDWDFSRFNPEFWQHFEERIMDLQKMGIETDIILYHTYDRWGFEYMDKESDDRYIRYAVARLSAYRNVWWSLV